MTTGDDIKTGDILVCKVVPGISVALFCRLENFNKNNKWSENET